MKAIHIQNKPTAGQTELAFSGIVSAKKFSYSITNFSGNELYELAEYEVENISEVDLVSIAIHQHHYAKTSIALDAAKYISTQVNGYEEDEAAALFESVLGLHYDETVFQSIIPNQAADIIFAEAISKKNTLSKVFGVNHFSHSLTGHIKNIVKDTAVNVLKICFDKNTLHATLSSDKRLMLVSAFDYQQPEDVLYVLLNIAKQFGIALESLQIKFSGSITNQSAVFQFVKPYFPNLMFDEVHWEMPLNEKYPKHYFAALYNLATCE